MIVKKDPLLEPFREFNWCSAQLPLLRVLFREAKRLASGERLGTLVLPRLIEAAARDAAHQDPDAFFDQKRSHREYFGLFKQLAGGGWGSLILGRRGGLTRFEFRERSVADLARVFAVLGIEPKPLEKAGRALPNTVSDAAAPSRSSPHQALKRDQVLSLLKEHDSEFRRFGVKTLSLFGSLARDEARADSDVDLLVAFDGPVTSEQFFGTKFLLEDLLGKRIDLVTDTALRERVRREIEPELIRVA